MKKITATLSLSFVICSLSFAQSFKYADTLRGTYGPGRDWWDALKYDIHVKFNLEDSTISGYNVIYYRVIKKDQPMQIDLQKPLVIDSVFFVGYIPLRYDKYEPGKIATPMQRITA